MIVISSLNPPICHKRKSCQTCKWVKIGQEQKGKWRCRFCVVWELKGKIAIMVHEWGTGQACAKHCREEGDFRFSLLKDCKLGRNGLRYLGCKCPLHYYIQVDITI